VTRYLTLAEYFWLADQITGVDAETLTKAARSARPSTASMTHLAIGLSNPGLSSRAIGWRSP
jgi:hypothetical protein